AGDDAQRTFMITRALIARFEAAFRTEPAHWHGWENLHRFSTAVDPAHRVDLDEPLRLLRAKCESIPDLLQAIPELAMLLEWHCHGVRPPYGHTGHDRTNRERKTWHRCRATEVRAHPE